MTALIDRILREFTPGISRLWIAADPDGVLLDERALSGLRQRGFELVAYEDPIAFRFAYEDEFRRRWNCGNEEVSSSLVLHLRTDDVSHLPADYLAQARVVRLSLADLFPMLSYAVVRQLDGALLAPLFDAQAHAGDPLGDDGTKKFVLEYLFRLVPHLIDRPEELWREMLRLHYRGGEGLPEVLAQHAAKGLMAKPAFSRLPLAELLASKATLLRVVQAAWVAYLHELGLSGSRVGEAGKSAPGDIEIPFDHPDVRVYIDSMFLDGFLHPIEVHGSVDTLPDWARVGVVPDPLALRNLVARGVAELQKQLPLVEDAPRAWTDWALRFGQILSRFHTLDQARADSVAGDVATLRATADAALLAWSRLHYANLPSLPGVKAPVMLHRTADMLATRRNAGEARIALVVFDGLAIDQWAIVREVLEREAAGWEFSESATFAWAPTLTSVSRQAIFSGMRPREFADTIEVTSAEEQLWKRFWQNEGLRSPEIVYRKGLQRTDQLPELETLLDPIGVKVAGLVVDMVDEMIHGAKLGKRGVAHQIVQWCETGFVARLFGKLIELGYHVYVTADHGNVDAIGIGSPGEGLKADVRGERVRAYRTQAQRDAIATAWPDCVQLDIPGLPSGFLPLYAPHGAAFVPAGSPVVVHGGLSVEEVLVPFVKVGRLS